MNILNKIRLLPGLMVLPVLQASPQTFSDSLASNRIHTDVFFEAGYNRNFFSDSPFRYKDPEAHRNDPSNGRFDLPRTVASVRYDAGKGWKMGADIALYHRATGSSYVREGEEKGLWQEQPGQGGSVALEQLWLEKSILPFLNLRIGHLVVPIGQVNTHNRPMDYFSAIAPEGESTILPSVWHQTGVSLWGNHNRLNYGLFLIGGLNSDQFSNTGWVHGGADSPLEFDVANKMAFAGRVGYTICTGLELNLSGYYGHSIGNSFPAEASGVSAKYNGAVIIGALDFSYRGKNFIVRGQADMGHLNDADKLTIVYNRVSTTSPYHNSRAVSDKAYAFSLEAGYDVFSQIERLRGSQNLFLFGRFGRYNPYSTPIHNYKYDYTEKTTFTAGINYLPTSNIVIKADYTYKKLKSPYFNEPSFSLSIGYDGRLF